MNYYSLHTSDSAHRFGSCTASEFMDIVNQSKQDIKGTFISGQARQDHKQIEEILIYYHSFLGRHQTTQAIQQKCYKGLMN